MNDDVKKERLKSFMDKGYLLSPEVFHLNEFKNEFLNFMNTRIISKEKPLVIGGDLYDSVSKKAVSGVNWLEFEKSKVLHEKGKTKRLYLSFLELITGEEKKEEISTVIEPVTEKKKIINSTDIEQPVVVKETSEIETPPKTIEVESKNTVQELVVSDPEDKYPMKLVKNFAEDAKMRQVKDFVFHYKSRYEKIKNMIAGRQEMQNVISIKRAYGKDKGESVALMGLVYEKRITKKGNLMIKLEDPSGTINVIFGPKIQESSAICLDELIGVVGTTSEGFMFATDLIYPDIPENKKVKTYGEDVCAAFISDVHVGSNMFIEDRFLKFIDWLNGEHEDPNMVELSKKVKFLFVVGDVVDGVGIYPDQDKELTIPSIRGQYDRCAELFGMIRKDIKIILCPGNHDARRIAEPQPALDHYAESLKSISNMTLVSNPATINVLSNENFEGFNILMYHGYSYDYYAANIESIAQEGGYDRGDLIMKYLLKKRHLAPVHTSTLFVPTPEDDHLIIDQVPDIFASGHIHKSSISKYRGVTNFVSSCWQHKTEFQERVGHHPEYCMVPIFNFKTGDSSMLDFSGGLNNES
ncbi:hypothetical protein HN992_03825 [Candidatus Woesearchaeota archaeon]|jgi:DNA polymerase II small subunit|nr:hypothetical protein [Candidatus Woesearchaeota archaeon]MBT3438442.1 hypothetical protein [Candidatus Woesearchaeota archaeon]MBT4058092.1 hypothetical protein [Candidatus Woesearchaeota archaeon]MBT4208811.1 hypothetical protein [Candidatus Woesearchaeota archaeon]MBT4731665.1 hypothetical protein [Candidatus Woesearchaeota archaeon]